MLQTRITIITVCFNAAETIERTIRSVCSQIYPHIEYIIIDGGSTDKTLEIVNKYAGRINKLISEKDNGIFDAMNKGIALATGDVLYFLNADDYFYDDHVLADVAKAFVEDPSRWLVYGNVVLEGAPQGVVVGSAKAFKTRSIHEFLHNAFCHQAVFARRSLFSTIGMFDCQYKYTADYEWIIKAFKLKASAFYYLDRKIAYYFFMGRSYQQSMATKQEVIRMQFRHLFSLGYMWYFFRYILVRGLKKRVLNERW